MQDGLYRVRFKTPLGSGAGVLLLQGGRVHGGDSTMYYHGTYSVSGGKLTATVTSAEHSSEPGHSSVFGVPRATITLAGNAGAATTVLTGTAKEAPGVKLEAELSRLV